MPLRLFLTFTRIGLFTIGGGYAVIPLIERDIVAREWLTKDEFFELIAICESLPGVFATNIATLVGYKVSGLKGSLSAALGTIIAPFFIIILIAAFFQKAQEHSWVTSAFKGIRPAVAALIVSPCISAIRLNRLTYKSGIFPATALVLMWQFNVSPFLIIIFGCLGGVVYNIVTAQKRAE